MEKSGEKNEVSEREEGKKKVGMRISLDVCEKLSCSFKRVKECLRRGRSGQEMEEVETKREREEREERKRGCTFFYKERRGKNDTKKEKMEEEIKISVAIENLSKVLTRERGYRETNGVGAMSVEEEGVM